MISKISGLDLGKIGNFMIMLVFILMGVLGKQKCQQGLDVGGLVNFLIGMVIQ